MKAAQEANRNQRVGRFLSLFNIPSFGFPTGYYEATAVKRLPLFEAQCEAILDTFSANWNSNCKHQEYLMTFTQRNWRKLPAAEKARCSHQKCVVSASQHTALQAFPGPTFKPDLASLYNSASTSRKDERGLWPDMHLQSVNANFEVNTFIRIWAKTVYYILTYSCSNNVKYGHFVTQSAATLCPEMHLQRKQTKTEVHTQKRKRDRQIRDKVNALLTAIILR